jgi:hypothetical protein
VHVGGPEQDAEMSAFQDGLHRRGGTIAFGAGIAVPAALVSLLFSERWTACARASTSLVARWLARLRRAGVTTALVAPFFPYSSARPCQDHGANRRRPVCGDGLPSIDFGFLCGACSRWFLLQGWSR